MTRKAVLTRIGAVTALVAGSVLGTALPAQAADVGNIGDLQTAFSDPAERSVTLTAGIVAPTEALSRPSGTPPLTLDLAGYELDVNYIDLLAGADLTITDSSGGGVLTATASDVNLQPGIRTTDAFLTINGGTVRASATAYAAGIGGGDARPGGTVTIDGGTVTAIGGDFAAGIGGGEFGDGGTVTIGGGTVDARGGVQAAGIGGGYYGDGGTVSIGGGTVTATGGDLSAGIGGGPNGTGGTVTVDAGTVTATGGEYAAGIGGGDGAAGAAVALNGGTTTAIAGVPSGPDYRPPSPVGPSESPLTGPAPDFGSLAIASGATLILREASNMQAIPAGVTVTNDGTIQTAATIVNDGVIAGAGALEQAGGTVTNNGVITLPTANIEPPERTFVSVNNYEFEFIDHGTTVGTERVYAPTFTDGERTMLPGVWNTAPDGSGDTVTADTDLTAGGGVISEELTPLYQQQIDAFTVTASPSPVAEGDTVTLTATVTTPTGQFDVTDETVFTTDQGDTVTDGTFIADTPVDRVVTAEYEGLTAETTVEVIPTVVSIELSADPTAVEVGGASTLKVVAYGSDGQPIGDVTQWSTFSSDVATDVFDGDTVTFPTASPHTITATFDPGTGPLTDSVVIDVIPAPTPTPAPAPAGGDHLASTGADPAAPAYAALALLLAGIAATTLRRRKRA